MTLTQCVAIIDSIMDKVAREGSCLPPNVEFRPQWLTGHQLCSVMEWGKGEGGGRGCSRIRWVA